MKPIILVAILVGFTMYILKPSKPTETNNRADITKAILITK